MSLTTILLILHLLAVAAWLGDGFASLILSRMVKAAQGTSAELTLRRTEIMLSSALGQVGGLGILITGLILTWTGGMAVLGIGGASPLWLTLKQVVYISLLVLVFGGIMPRSIPLVKSFMAAAEKNSAVTAEMRATHDRIHQLARIHTILVIINVVLAVWKPQ